MSLEDIVIGINNKVFGLQLCQIEEHLYIGTYAAIQMTRMLNENNIKTVLSIIDHQIAPELRVDGIAYHTIRVTKESAFELLSYFPTACHIINETIKSGANILIHCIDGTSLSTTIIVAYLMAKYEISTKGAQNLVASRRRLICPINGFGQQLMLFESMGYTLNANNQQFRQFIAEIYANKDHFKAYFDRQSVAENITKDLNYGKRYICRKCNFLLFHELHVLVNDEKQCETLDEVRNWSCDRIFVEPMRWMRNQLEDKQQIIRCTGCSQVVAKLKVWLLTNGCKCRLHDGIQCLQIHVMDNCFKIVSSNQ
ncbi:dual specificity protein phosphatase 22-B-like [Oppia nitens]|uniref:dual specificity protein phosphatase 22-B-like n=1 Tax=Oppia nitens TaxID=1686743 RepID=UPI0023DA5710|nr:dual specificity protein phosphatase 22-B-like [Oppia nitens]